MYTDAQIENITFDTEWLDGVNLNEAARLTPSKALAHNAKLIRRAGELFAPHLEKLRSQGLKADYDLESLPDVLLAIARQCSIYGYHFAERFPNEPTWVKEGRNGELSYDFTPPSVELIVMAGIYWGETLIRNAPHLFWTLGKARVREHHIPWIGGWTFKGGKDFNPITINRNNSMHVVRDNQSKEEFFKVIFNWNDRVLNHPDPKQKPPKIKLD